MSDEITKVNITYANCCMYVIGYNNYVKKILKES